MSRELLRRAVGLSCGLLLGLASPSRAASPDGNTRLEAAIGHSTVLITTSQRLAGAIGSFQWNGHEFVNQTDHGRELQSACSFDNSPTANAETLNPTEAGSRRDGDGTNSTSRPLEVEVQGRHLRTRTQMAFWLAPGERSEGQLARNTNALSEYILTKEVTIGFRRWPQALDYRVMFSMPAGCHHVSAQFEALTGYMPEDFRTFWEFNPATGKLQPLSDGPGEIRNPVVLATADGNFAMGIFAPAQSAPDTSGPTFGRWRFAGARVVKWNCVYRVHNAAGIADGAHAYRLLVPFGTLAQVESMLRDWRELRW